MLSIAKRLVVLLTLTAASIGLGSCGGSGGSEPIQPSAVSVSIDPPSATFVGVGATGTLTATVLDKLGPVASPTVQWTSNPTGVVDLTGTGAVVALTTKGVGTTTVQAKSGGQTATSVITVQSAPVATIAIVDRSVSIAVGSTKQLGAQLRDARGNDLTGRTITWSSNKANFAAVGTSSGLVDAKAKGLAWVIAESEGKKDSIPVTVNPGPVASISISPPTLNVIINTSQQLTATVKDAADTVLANQTVTWSSGTTSLASVSSTGQVQGLAVGGPVLITATSGTKSATATVQVKAVPIAKIVVQPPSTRLPINQTAPFVVGLRDAAGNLPTGAALAPPIIADATVADWSFSNGQFVVRGLKVGSTKITFRDADPSSTVSAEATIDVVSAGAVITLIGSGNGSGRITSTPALFDCVYSAGVATGTCSTTVTNGTNITLIPTRDPGSSFAWPNAPCAGFVNCQLQSVLLPQVHQFSFTKP